MGDTPNPRTVRLAVDIGGTFVDAVTFDRASAELRFRKASTTPDAPSQGVMEAIERLDIPLDHCEIFIHGTTLGLNAVLTRRGATTGIITNDGLRDIFFVGRGDVPWAHMYDFQYDRPPPLVPRRRCLGVPGRLDERGRELTPLDEDAVRAAAGQLVEQGVDSIAICFLHSYREPAHEQRAAAVIRGAYPQVTVSISSDIAREQREYERTSTTVIDAYIRPIFERYVERLRSDVRTRGFVGRFLITRSGGGAMTAEAAATSPTQTILSGPAGGIAGSSFLAETLGRDDLLSFDIGGTSLDTCVVEQGQAVAAYEAKLEHHPLLIPIYDIRTIGAGGGSIAWIDDGLLRVGPQSAGATPGPIAYGRGGTEPTVTDAAVALGYIDPTRFLDGDMALDAAGARDGIERVIANPLGLSVDEAAVGIFDVMLAKTVGAVRQITVERGRDPQTFSLLAFGGAGPLLASMLAREMRIREVIVPNTPAGFSAWGMLSADVVDDVVRADLRVLDETTVTGIDETLTELEEEAARSLREQDVADDDVILHRELELRYKGQEHALVLPVGRQLDIGTVQKDFDELHRARYGHAIELPVQVLNARVRGVGRFGRPALNELEPGDGDVGRALVSRRDAFCFVQREAVEFAVLDRARLARGDIIEGPAIVDEGTSTTVLHTGQRLEVDAYGHLLIQL